MAEAGSDDLQVFVDDPSKITCMILLYSTPGLPDVTAVEYHARNVGIVCGKDNTTYILMNMLGKCVPWTQNLVFVGIDSRYVTSSIKRFIQIKQNGKYNVSTYDQLEIDRKTLDKAMANLPPIPPGILAL